MAKPHAEEAGDNPTLVSCQQWLSLLIGQAALDQMNFPDYLDSSTTLEGRHVDVIAFFENAEVLSFAGQSASGRVEPLHRAAGDKRNFVAIGQEDNLVSINTLDGCV